MNERVNDVTLFPFRWKVFFVLGSAAITGMTVYGIFAVHTTIFLGNGLQWIFAGGAVAFFLISSYILLIKGRDV